MMDVMWVTLTRNAVLLLGLFAVFEATYLIPDSKQRLRQGVSSLFIAVICFAVMSTPFVLYTGVVFDTRTIIISITSLIFGWIPAIVVMAVATFIRLSAGGAGMIAGVLTIFTSGMVGLIWRRFLDPEKTKNIWVNVYVMSVVVHVVMLLCQLFIPSPQNMEVIRQIALPVMVIYPGVSTLLTMLLLRQKNYRQMQSDLVKSEEKYRAMFHSAGIGVCNTDLHGKITDANKRFMEIMGYTKEELSERTFEDLTHPDDLGLTEEVLRKLFHGEISRFVLEKRYLAKDGHTVFADLSVAMVRDKRGAPLYTVTTVQDITDKKIQEEQIQYLFTHDNLTGLYNRRSYNHQKMEMDKETVIPLSVVLVNINGLRLINSGFGKEVGDRCIQETAKRLKEVFSDTEWIFRVSGDEFWVLLPNVDEKKSGMLVREMADKSLVLPFEDTKDGIHWDLSIGSSTRTTMDQIMDEVLKTAEDIVENKRLLSHHSSRNNLVSTMMVTLAERSHETESHAKRLAMVCRKIGERLNLSEMEQDKLELFSMLHDVGKIAIDSRILNKPGRLTLEEWTEMKKHPDIGFRITMSTSNLEPIAQYVLTHHERWDGGGYPRGLAGEGIPLLSRILSVADAYDAMTEDRIYRKAMSREEAAQEIRRNLGTQFDPFIGSIFLDLLKEDENL